MHVITTIIPIFAVISLGWAARKKGFMPPDFLMSANRLVYYLAIPAMLFRLLCRASLRTHINSTSVSVTLISILVLFCFAWGVGLASRIKREHLGTFMHSTIHGNLGYIGLAVSFYALGDAGLIRAGIIAGFMILMQNLLGVVAHQFYNNNPSVRRPPLSMVWKILGNPVIFASIAGIAYNLTDLPVPIVIDRSFKILGDLALPMALLVIGASLSFEMMRLRLGQVFSSSMIKLVLLPGLGLILFKTFGVAVQDYLPGLILLASPTATVTYVMARELNGDPDFAVAAISTSTMLSALTFSVWLIFAGISS
jgi:malate permease and related proteins